MRATDLNVAAPRGKRGVAVARKILLSDHPPLAPAAPTPDPASTPHVPSFPFRSARRAFLAALLLSSAAALSASGWRYHFGALLPPDEAHAVHPSDHYDDDHGFGFEGAPSLHEGEVLGSDQPFLFSVKLPEGTYRVTVVLGDPKGSSNTTIKAEGRRLMVESATTAPGEQVTRTFLVNVRDTELPPPPRNAPGGTFVRINEREVGSRTWDNRLTLEFNGPAPRLASLAIERAEVPAVFLLGDSTVTDQPAEPGASWGQMLPRFFRPTVVVANHAESGETLKSFLTGLRLDKVLSQVKAGDYVFIQFGHNDSKPAWPQTYVPADSTYRDYLRVYLAEVRRRGATPVLLTSPHRRTFGDDGRIRNSHGGYPAAVRAVAAEEHVALIDLHAMSAAFYEALGPTVAPRAFSANGEDATHHNNYGAYELARCVAAGLRATGLPLANELTDDALPFDPAKPDPVDAFHLPPSPGYSTVTPRGS